MTQLEPNRTGKRRNYLESYLEQDGCWIYTGSINNRGYGTILGRTAHRYFYERMVGPIPDGLRLDHLCRIKAWVNPKHLEPVTDSQNMQRRPDVNKTHCLHGHALTANNLIIKHRANGRQERNCRECKNQQRRVNRAA